MWGLGEEGLGLEATLLGAQINLYLFAVDIHVTEKPSTTKMYQKCLWKSDILNQNVGH